MSIKTYLYILDAIVVSFVVFCAAVVLAAEPDPRLAQIQQQRQEIQEKMGRAELIFRAITTIEQGEAKLRDLNEEERKIKAETESKVKDAK